MFLANVVLARSASKEEYGVFALSYSVFTFLAGLHNAAILEPYTVHGAGRYREQYPAYVRIMWGANARLAIGLTAVLFLGWQILAWTVPAMASKSLLGLALSSGILLTASLRRRMLYVQRQPQLAAQLSLIFFVTLAVSLWICVRFHAMDGLSAFLVVALSWCIALLCLTDRLPRKTGLQNFFQSQPGYWLEHWKYARWVLATAFVFQLTTQGYYWVVAGFLSLKEVGQLRAIYILVTPMDQVLGALTLLILPMMAARYASSQIAGLLSLWKFYAVISLFITLAFSASVVVFGRPIVHLVYHGKFDEVSSLLTILAFMPVIMTIGNTMNAALKAAERPNMVFYAYIASGVATFFLGIPLVIHFGLRGAVYGMLVSASFYTIFLAINFVSFLQLNPLNWRGTADAEPISQSGPVA